MTAYVTFPEQQTVVYFTSGESLGVADVGKFLVISSGAVVKNTTAGGVVAGVLGNLQGTVASGSKVPVIINGVALVQGGGTVAVGGTFNSANDGQAVAATTGRINGYAIEALADGTLAKAYIDALGTHYPAS